METRTHFVVVSVTEYESRRFVSLKPFCPELSTEQLDNISDDDYGTFTDEWGGLGFAIHSNRHDENLPSTAWMSERAVIDVWTDQDWVAGQVLEVTVRPTGMRGAIEQQATAIA